MVTRAGWNILSLRESVLDENNTNFFVAATKGFNGGGIYDSSNDFGLDTNTLVLFVFCLVIAIVFSYAYVCAARAFTKQFIWITGILHVVFGFVTAIYMLSRKYWSGGIVSEPPPGSQTT